MRVSILGQWTLFLGAWEILSTDISWGVGARGSVCERETRYRDACTDVKVQRAEARMQQVRTSTQLVVPMRD